MNRDFTHECFLRAQKFFNAIEPGDVISYKEPKDCGTTKTRKFKLISKWMDDKLYYDPMCYHITVQEEGFHDSETITLNGEESILSIFKEIKF